MKTLLTVAALLCSTAPAFCQASWTYRVGFALNDRNSQQIHDYDITSGKYRVFTSNYPETGMHYVSSVGLFHISGSATYPGVAIGLTNGVDSTVVILPSGSERTILTNWPTKPGIYNLELEYGTYRIKHPEAILCYPTQFRQDDKRLFSLTVLDWSKYQTNPTDYDGNLKGYFQHEVKTQRDK